jgi:hypothetical protein
MREMGDKGQQTELEAWEHQAKNRNKKKSKAKQKKSRGTN